MHAHQSASTMQEAAPENTLLILFFMHTVTLYSSLVAEAEKEEKESARVNAQLFSSEIMHVKIVIGPSLCSTTCVTRAREPTL